MSDLIKKLSEEIQSVDWGALVPHFERDAVVEVDGSLRIVDVGVALANDDSAIVEEWLKSGLLMKPSKEQSSDWSEEKVMFQFVIVQPYVLVQKIKSTN